MDFHLFINFNPIRKLIINGNITLKGRTVLKTHEILPVGLRATYPENGQIRVI